MTAPPIRFLLSDVDGTLVTGDKRLTERTVDAVQRLHAAGIGFAVTSSRPPRGMEMLTGPLAITTPLAGFNGGVLVDSDHHVIEQKTVPPELVQPIIEAISSAGLDVWLFRGRDEWFVRDAAGPHVARESHTVGFSPTVVDDFGDMTQGIAKIVGVSDNHEAVAAATAAAHNEFGDEVSANRSQLYYLDVTHPDANKGAVARYIAKRYDIPAEQIATIGDMPNDVLMFAHSGLSIAMGQSGHEVQRAARRVTTSNEDEGFANAVDWFILRTSPPHLTGDLDAGPERNRT